MSLLRNGWTVLAIAGTLVALGACRGEDDRPASPPTPPGGIAGAAGKGVAEEPPAVCLPETLVAYASKPGAGQIPAAPEDAPEADGAPMQFAVNRMFLGDTDLEGSPSPNAWKDIGLDVDGFSSDKAFDCNCKSASKQAKSDIRTDGTNGIDNAFGNILIAQGTVPIENASQSATAGIEAGADSLVLSFSALGGASSYRSVRAMVSPVQMAGGGAPRFDGADHWHPFAEAPLSSVVLDGGWVTDHTWVSPPTDQTLVVTARISGIAMLLPIQRPRITARFSLDHSEIVRGIISGVMSTDAYIGGLRRVFGWRLNLCGAAFDSVAEQIRQASDSPLNGVHDPNVVCDGMSVGIGFKARRTGSLGDPISVVEEPDRCPVR